MDSFGARSRLEVGSTYLLGHRPAGRARHDRRGQLASARRRVGAPIHLSPSSTKLAIQSVGR
jgi:hypothetical protein